MKLKAYVFEDDNGVETTVSVELAEAVLKALKKDASIWDELHKNTPKEKPVDMPIYRQPWTVGDRTPPWNPNEVWCGGYEFPKYMAGTGLSDCTTLYNGATLGRTAYDIHSLGGTGSVEVDERYKGALPEEPTPPPTVEYRGLCRKAAGFKETI